MTLLHRPQDHFPRRISQYVPAMRYSAELMLNGLTGFSLGSPAVADADGILNDKSATSTAQSYTSADFETTFDGSSTSLTTTSGMMDATYGRNVTLTGTAGSDHVVTITGRDYLGQVMSEALTLSGTNVIVGQKAFKYITSIDVAVGAASDTFDMGWGDKLGLPYKFGEIAYATEGGVFAPTALEIHQYGPESVTVSGANAATFTADVDGFVIGWQAEVTTAVTTAAAVMDAVIDGTGVAALDGTIPVAAAGFLAGVRTANNVAAQAINVGETFVLTSDGGPAAGAVDIIALVARPQGGYALPDTTDPATTTTGDVRGTYEAFSTYDGSTEIVVYMTGDPTVNASGNGGLHGIAQV